MNNKIEEMARDIYEQKSCDASFEESCKTLAYDLVALGYQKIDKDSVVLSREEQEKILTATGKRIKELKKQILQARKETAEKIFDTLYQWLDLEEIEKYGFVTIQKFDFLCKFREIYKQFGVEIKE